MTLNEISENIAFALGDQFNDTLKQAIKHTVIVYRAKLIRDDINRNFISHTDYFQSFVSPLEEINLVEGDDSTKMLRTVNKIPTPLFLPYGKTSFKFVGQVDGGASFVYAHIEEYKFLKDLQYQHNVIYYTWENNYIYILNNLKLCAIRISGIFTDPRDINLSCEEKQYMFTDDKEFPIAAHLLVTIEKGIINGDFPVITDGKEVNINPDKNG